MATRSLASHNLANYGNRRAVKASAPTIWGGRTNRWTGARIASFSTCFVRRWLDVIAAPGQLKRSAARDSHRIVKIDVLINELNVLRAELRDLKSCQIQYVSLSVTGTGAIIGFAATLASPSLRGVACLAPLVILLPCWWIFFDKATTITRLVGYVRVLETMISDADAESSKFAYIGYENALGLFRLSEKDFPKKLKGLFSSLVQVLRLRTRHRFWTVNWYTFGSLSVVCWVLAFKFLEGTPTERKGALVIAAVLIVGSAVFTLRMVRDLIAGKYSYEHTTFVWNQILRVGALSTPSDEPPNKSLRVSAG